MVRIGKKYVNKVIQTSFVNISKRIFGGRYGIRYCSGYVLVAIFAIFVIRIGFKDHSWHDIVLGWILAILMV